METDTVLRQWGNSLGIVIPKEIIKEEKLKKNERVHVIIKKNKTTTARDIFGMFPELKKPTAEIMKGVDRDLSSKF